MPTTDRTELYTQLHSTSPHERLSAVRQISRGLDQSDLPLLRAALATEPTLFVKKALRVAVERLQHPELAERERESVPEGISRRDVSDWRATREVTATLLHEILPRLGGIEFEAQKLIEGYDDSKLAGKINGLKDLMTAMQQLQRVTHPSSPTDFPIYKILCECISEEETADLVSYDGDKKLVVLGDPNLIKLAFCNGLRNAVEASADADAKPIVVTWGESDVHYYVRIIDSGLGLKGPADAAMKIGSTTKDGHTGFGLSIAKAAMASLDGEITLEPNNPSGMTFSMKWYRP